MSYKCDDRWREAVRLGREIDTSMNGSPRYKVIMRIVKSKWPEFYDEILKEQQANRDVAEIFREKIQQKADYYATMLDEGTEALLQRAISGDVQAYQAVAARLAGTPKQSIDVTSGGMPLMNVKGKSDV